MLFRFRPPSSPALVRHSLLRTPSNKRHFIQYLNEGFLDLALALPYPAHWPAYSATIILVTVAVRVAVLPSVFWSLNRQRRYEKHVIPALRQLKPVVMHEQAIAMQKEGLLQDKDTRGKIHAKRCHDIMTAKGKELEKTHRCSTLPTTLIPALAQMPPFMIMTIMFARIAADPTSPFDSETFLTLITLNHPDPTFTLPVIVGLVTMANVESSSWFMNATEKAALKENQEKRAEMVAKSQDKWSMVKLNLVNNLKDSMRVLSVLRIGLASIAPGAVVLYWVTSSTFGLFQTWVINWLDMKSRRNAVAPVPPPALAALQARSKISQTHTSSSDSALAVDPQNSTPDRNLRKSKTGKHLSRRQR